MKKKSIRAPVREPSLLGDAPRGAYALAKPSGYRHRPHIEDSVDDDTEGLDTEGDGPKPLDQLFR